MNRMPVISIILNCCVLLLPSISMFLRFSDTFYFKSSFFWVSIFYYLSTFSFSFMAWRSRFVFRLFRCLPPSTSVIVSVTFHHLILPPSLLPIEPTWTSLSRAICLCFFRVLLCKNKKSVPLLRLVDKANLELNTGTCVYKSLCVCATSYST